MTTSKLEVQVYRDLMQALYTLTKGRKMIVTTNKRKEAQPKEKEVSIDQPMVGIDGCLEHGPSTTGCCHQTSTFIFSKAL